MEKKFLSTLTCCLFILALAMFLPLTAKAALEGGSGLMTGLKTTSKGAALSDGGAPMPVSSLIGQIIGIVLSFLGVIFFILIAYGGFLWMTSQGNDEQIGKAKRIMVTAIVGLTLVLSAYAITEFVVGESIFTIIDYAK